MDSIKILKRAFHITLDYRALWLFGILLALTAGGFRGSGSNGGSGGGSGTSNSIPFPPNSSNAPWNWNWDWRFAAIPAAIVSTIITVGIILICVAVILAIAFAVIRYVSETAAIRMVDRYEASGEKVSIGQGWRLGWSRAAFRLFLIDFLIHLVGFFAFLLLISLAAAPMLLWLTRNDAARVIGTVMAIGLGVLVILAAILAVIILAVLIPFMFRACVLEDIGVMEAMRRGVQLVRGRLEDVVVLAVILFALGLAWVVVMIPLVIMLLLAGGLLGGLPGLLVGGIASQFVQDEVAVLLGVLVALPIFLAVVILPTLFVNGLMKVFTSSTWTLAYRELIALEGARADVAPKPVEPLPVE